MRLAIASCHFVVPTIVFALDLVLAWIYGVTAAPSFLPKTPTSQNDTMTMLRHSKSVKVILSYVFDWVVLIAVGVVSTTINTL
ncbi:uncharacterized protein BDV17DRAFT_296199 [Aspergillus undulatus]|uniref:uncharacterized protein n=1 Tax=Aspergillus undulatus TaxID=1810928 RepID=UPI003CCE36C2